MKASYLELVSPLPAQGLQGKAQVVCFCQRTKIKIILGINTGRNVDVELQQFKKLSLQLIPASKDSKSSCLAALPGCVAHHGKVLETRLEETVTSREESHPSNCLAGHQSCSLATK